MKCTYKFGEFIVLPSSHEIVIDGRAYSVKKKLMQVLVVLIEADGEIVTKKELSSKVWKGTIVTENSIEKAISELRKVLVVSSGRTYIETIPKSGFRSIQKVAKIHQLKKTKMAIIALVALIVLSCCVWFLFKKTNSRTNVPVSISPSGQKIVSMINHRGRTQIIIEDLNKEKEEKLNEIESPESYALNWSPDGVRIIYNTTTDENSFYSVEVMSISTREILYVKFLKDAGFEGHENLHLSDRTEKIEHVHLGTSETQMHFLYLNDKDTIKVLFQNGLIKGFEW